MKKIMLNRYRRKPCLWAFIDDRDYKRVKKHKWYRSHQGYAITNIDGKRVYLHRFILGYPDGSVDHISRIKLDNRRSNLRICTTQENVRNSNLSRANTSGYKGVSWRSDRKKWRAYIFIDYKQLCLGVFEKLEDAIKVRKEAELKLWI